MSVIRTPGQLTTLRSASRPDVPSSRFRMASPRTPSDSARAASTTAAPRDGRRSMTPRAHSVRAAVGSLRRIRSMIRGASAALRRPSHSSVRCTESLPAPATYAAETSSATSRMRSGSMEAVQSSQGSQYSLAASKRAAASFTSSDSALDASSGSASISFCARLRSTKSRQSHHGVPARGAPGMSSRSASIVRRTAG